jgi:hypothetical protein
MVARFRSFLTFGNVVSLVALFIALSGGAYALTLPRNSVGTKQLKKNAVASSKIRKGAVSSSKVKDHSLLAKDFRAGQLPTGATGPQGPQGPQGQTGAPGTARAYAMIDPRTCTTTAGSCTLIRAKNVVAARRSPNNPTGFYCVTTGPGIDRQADGFMAGVVWDLTQGPEGNASAMAMDDPPPTAAQVCPGDFTVVTERITSGTTNFATDVGFWFAVG